MLGTDPLAPGGISGVLREYAAAGLADRWPIEWIPTWRRAASTDRLLSAAAAAAWLWRLLVEGRLQAVHAHMAARGSTWRKTALLAPVHAARKPVILHVHDGGFHDWWAAQPGTLRRVIRDELTRAHRLVALDETAQAQLQSIAPRARVVVLPNPVAVGPDDAQPIAGRVLMLSRLWPQKGVDDLLQAAARLQQPCELVCAGDGNLQDWASRARALGVSHRVRWTGWLDGQDKREALRSAQILVLPSHVEGQPMALLEAMSASVPVVATTIGGIPALLREGGGRLVPPRDPHALAQALDALLGDPAHARQLGAQGRRFVMRHHESSVVVSRLESLYHDLGLQPLPLSTHGAH